MTVARETAARNWAASTGKQLLAAMEWLFRSAFDERTSLRLFAYLILYIAGLLLWGYLLNWGEIPFGLHDWAEGTGHRLAFLQNAIQESKLPLHMPDGSALRNVTDRFISTPDTILSPQLLLLGFVGLGEFVVINTMLLYSVGFIGLVLIAKRLRLSVVSFTAVFLLFSFNGHITDHIIVGHMHWAGYFLLPLFVLLVLDAMQRRPGWTWTLKVGVLMLFMFLQGSFHLFVMSLLFLALLAVGDRRMRAPAAKAGIATLALSLGRLLPPALEAEKFDSEFLSGFISVRQLLAALIEIRTPIPSEVFDPNPLMPLGWWEIDHYVGMVGTGFLLVFGIAYAWREGKLNSTLAIPMFTMAFLSIGRIYRPLNLLGIPLLSSQRVSTRFVIFAIVFLIVIAAHSLQHYFNRNRISTTGRLGLLALLALMGHDLWQHVKLWRIERMYDLFPMREVDLSAEYVANHLDPPYTTALVVGWGVALLALGVLTALSLKERTGATQRGSAGGLK
jgi:hypothetical protein